ncbi:GNAT family N-acetyltransferase [Enterocloster clostridioformis]|uniref:GNAT family N-acetyltransferase n=1 Tax=Enterocloster clostridioformis TaxID=1531 RepID=UPI0003F96F27|nr:GNAT family N-acetyltransferase [Enterocloster clostridioformis]
MKLQDYMDKKPVLETGQLILRPLQVSDVADLKEWMGAPSLYQYWSWHLNCGIQNTTRQGCWLSC